MATNRSRNAVLFLALVAAIANAVAAEDPAPKSVTEQTPATVPTVTVDPPTNGTSAPQPKKTDTNAVVDDSPAKPIQLDLYYESLCSDSVNFVKEQLVPTYEKFGKYINVTFVPFAQGNITGSDIYTCQREKECDADKVHACAIKYITDKDILLKFVNCSLVEAFGPKVIPFESCANKSGINNTISNSIQDCIKGTEIKELFDRFYKESREVNVTNVPKIVINKINTEIMQSAAEKNLKKVVCEQFTKEKKPEECKDIDSGSNTVMVGVLPIFIGLYYIIRMF